MAQMACNAAGQEAGGPVNIWQETFPVRFGAIDRSDRMTLDAAFQFFQEAAISHAENLGVGREAMAKTGQGWILSRISVKINRRPRYYEIVTVRTWPRGWEKLFAVRDFDILDKDDVPVIQARSCWLIVDLEKRRPLRPQSVMGALPQNEGLDALAQSPANLAERANLQKTGERKALYTDIDYNGHVNNVRYIQWIEDALDPQLLEEAEKMRLNVNYSREVLSGEAVEIFSTKCEEGGPERVFAFEGRKTGKESESETAFRAELRLYR
ncbi:MAG: acyl-ACP thioesterase [Treponema sp.]|jgi:acyl-ACP thioesterase|nr:acyl-ACP thioesterase [Treponema sp.]